MDKRAVLEIVKMSANTEERIKNDTETYFKQAYGHGDSGDDYAKKLTRDLTMK